MTCDHARCDAEATVRCRMGDGYVRQCGPLRKQPFVHYCDRCFQVVDGLFVLCDVALIAQPHSPKNARAHAREAASRVPVAA